MSKTGVLDFMTPKEEPCVVFHRLGLKCQEFTSWKSHLVEACTRNLSDTNRIGFFGSCNIQIHPTHDLVMAAGRSSRNFNRSIRFFQLSAIKFIATFSPNSRELGNLPSIKSETSFRTKLNLIPNEIVPLKRVNTIIIYGVKNKEFHLRFKNFYWRELF